MDPRFRSLVDALHPQCEALRTAPTFQADAIPRDLPRRGLYLFSENGKHLYVGRTNRMRERLKDHCRPSGTHFKATFAVCLARMETGIGKGHIPRAELATHPIFGPAFLRAKARVARMEIRCLRVDGAVEQALLEIYVATVLETVYNDFENH